MEVWGCGGVGAVAAWPNKAAGAKLSLKSATVCFIGVYGLLFGISGSGMFYGLVAVGATR